MYDYFEPNTRTLIDNVTLIKEDNRVSEQTFGISISFGSPGAGIRAATLQQTTDQTTNFEYVIVAPGVNRITRSFFPFQSEITLTFFLQPDKLPEGTEGFRAIIASLGDPFPNFQLPLVNPLPAIPAYANTLIRILDDDCKCFTISYILVKLKNFYLSLAVHLASS